MKRYVVSLSIGDNVEVTVDAADEDQAFDLAQDIVHERFKILDGDTQMGLGYVFLNEFIEEDG